MKVRWKPKKPQRFVPRVVLGMGIVGVVPACAIQACGSGTFAPADAGKDQVFTVAATCFNNPSMPQCQDAPVYGVAATCFNNPNMPQCRDAPLSVADTAFGVADVGFRPDASDANDEIKDSPGPDLILAVAFIGFVDLENSGKSRA
jgi:hypothetical protein